MSHLVTVQGLQVCKVKYSGMSKKRLSLHLHNSRLPTMHSDCLLCTVTQWSQITSILLKTLKAVLWPRVWCNAAEAHQRPAGRSTVGDTGQQELLNSTVQNEDCKSSKDFVRKDAPLPGRGRGALYGQLQPVQPGQAGSLIGGAAPRSSMSSRFHECTLRRR